MPNSPRLSCTDASAAEPANYNDARAHHRKRARQQNRNRLAVALLLCRIRLRHGVAALAASLRVQFRG